MIFCFCFYYYYYFSQHALKLISDLYLFMLTMESGVEVKKTKTVFNNCCSKVLTLSLSQINFKLRTVSLFLERPWERTQKKYACERDCERDVGAAMPRAASSVAVTVTFAPYLFCVLSHGLSEEKRDCSQSR